MHPSRLLSLLAVAITAAAALLGGATTTMADDDQVMFVANFTCSPTRNYTDDSPYGKNLAELLSTLSTLDPATVDNWWFRSRTVGTGPDQASGVAMCYADTDAAQCRSCLRAVNPMFREVFFPSCDHSRNMSLIRSDGCVIRYADAPFFGSADRSDTRIVLRSPVREGGDAAAGKREARGQLLSHLAEMAGGDARRFATGSWVYVEEAASGFRAFRQVVYGMAQCTRDLPLSECTSCLLDQLAVMYSDVSVTNSPEASVMAFSCYLRYQWNKPIDIAGLAQPPSPPPTAEHSAGSSAPHPLVGKPTTTMLVVALALVAAGPIVTLFNP